MVSRIVTQVGGSALVVSPFRRLHIVKAVNPLTATGFDRIVRDLTRTLVRNGGRITNAEMQSVYRGLDVDWATATDAKVRRLTEQIGRAMTAAGRKASVASTKELKESGESVVKDTRRASVRTHKLEISARTSAKDVRAIQRVAVDQAAFVTDYHGRLDEGLSLQAKDIVSEGLERGLQNDVIAKQLELSMRGSLLGRHSSYYSVVSNAFVNRARSYSALRSYQDAEIERYIIEAVLDEVTTDTCRGLHGKTLEVRAGLDTIKAVDELEDPRDVKFEQPWFVEKQIAQGPDAGKRGLFIPQKKGSSLLAAVIQSSGRGQRDNVGKIDWRMSDGRLQGAGIGTPPYHGRCRTTILPDI